MPGLLTRHVFWHWIIGPHAASGWHIHCGVEVTELPINNALSHTELYFAWTTPRPELLTYASPGRVDQLRSCAVRCKDWFFCITSSQTCRQHSTQTCAPGEYQAGDHARDATCLPCSGCAGRRRLASCTADDACAECGSLGARQRWVTEGHDECVLSYEPGFELNTRTRACELCTTKCGSGELPLRVRDNCTHCEACPPQAREIQLAHAGLLLRLLLGMRAEARARW
jgi:hypothetical protein